jgi:hypothetical protein
MTHVIKPPVLAALACLALAACTPTPPLTPAEQAAKAACEAQAEAAYDQNTLSDAGHTDQTGQRYGATPTHVFDAEHMGAQHAYLSQVQNCEATGINNGQPVPTDVPTVAPHIITN